jgi:hypothetical protein
MQKSLLVCGIHPVLVYHINTDNQCCWKPQQILLASLISASYICRINHPQAFKYMTFKTQNKMNIRILNVRKKKKTLHFSKVAEPALWPSQPSTEW